MVVQNSYTVVVYYFLLLPTSSSRWCCFAVADAAEEDSPPPSQHRRATLRAMSVLGRRQLTIERAEWVGFLSKRNMDLLGSNGDLYDDGKDESYSESSYQNATPVHEKHQRSQSFSIPWYCRPVQHQQWDDNQVLPHINWGDLFFDLFYVAAAYNLGGMIISQALRMDMLSGGVQPQHFHFFSAY
jgi:hypothetical protein